MNPAAESEYVQRLKIERQAVETLYQAFSDNNPDLVDSVLAPSWGRHSAGTGTGARAGRHQADHSHAGAGFSGRADRGA